MKNSIFKKICAVSLSALMFVGTGAAEAGSFIGASLPVYAASVTPASDFEYVTNYYTGTITITDFKGTQSDVNKKSHQKQKTTRQLLHCRVVVFKEC